MWILIHIIPLMTLLLDTIKCVISGLNNGTLALQKRLYDPRQEDSGIEGERRYAIRRYSEEDGHITGSRRVLLSEIEEGGTWIRLS